MPVPTLFRRATAAVSLIVAAGCSSASTAPIPVTPPTGNTVNVAIGNNFFTPSSDTVAVGSTVVWTMTNTASVVHNVVSQGTTSANTFTSSNNLMAAGATYSFTFATAGTYPYWCSIHGSVMSGKIVVK